MESKALVVLCLLGVVASAEIWTVKVGEDSPHPILPVKHLVSPSGRDVEVRADMYGQNGRNMISNKDGVLFNLRGAFTVPPKPKQIDRNIAIFLWYGIQPYNVAEQQGGVIQPVLTFGCSCASQAPDCLSQSYYQDPYWWVSSMYVYRDQRGKGTYQCPSGPSFRVEPGELLESTIVYDEATGTYNQTVVSLDNGKASILSDIHPWGEEALVWKDYAKSAYALMIVEANSLPNTAEDVQKFLPPITQWNTTWGDYTQVSTPAYCDHHTMFCEQTAHGAEECDFNLQLPRGAASSCTFGPGTPTPTPHPPGDCSSLSDQALNCKELVASPGCSVGFVRDYCARSCCLKGGRSAFLNIAN